MIISYITADEAAQLMGKPFATDMFFNPVQDESSNWFITGEEIEQCTNAEFEWVKDLKIIEV